MAKLDLIDKDFCDDVIQTLEMPGGLAALTAGAKLQAKYTGKAPGKNYLILIIKNVLWNLSCS